MEEPTVYHLAPGAAARLVGGMFVGTAVVCFVASLVVGLLDLPTWVFAVVAVVTCAGAFALARRLGAHRRAFVVRCDDIGYEVGSVRGAGVKQARWTDVVDCVATDRGGIPCLELRLRDGGTTTIPVQLLAVDREQFARDVRERLQHAHRRR